MAMRDALAGAYMPEGIDRSFNERVMELYMAGTLSREDVERLLHGPEVKREPRRTMMTERQLLDVIDRAIAEFRHVEGTYNGVDWMQLDREHDVASFALIRLGRPIRDPGLPRYLCKCGWPLEQYFNQTLPCAICSDRNDATVRVDPGPTPQHYYLQLRVIFHRNREAKRWDPQPCIDRYVDTRLTEMLEDAGLGRALMPIEPPPYAEFQSFVEQANREVMGAFANVPVETGRAIAIPPPPPEPPPAPLLCQLGLTCPIHYPKKPEPYVPTVTDWDLLPDVVPDALRVRR